MIRRLSKNGKNFRLCLPKVIMDEINRQQGFKADFAEIEYLGGLTFKIIPL